jgi:hypothetical protein
MVSQEVTYETVVYLEVMFLVVATVRLIYVYCIFVSPVR